MHGPEKGKDAPHRKKAGGKQQKGRRQKAKRSYHFAKKAGGFQEQGTDTDKHMYINQLHMIRTHITESPHTSIRETDIYTGNTNSRYSQQ